MFGKHNAKIFEVRMKIKDKSLKAANVARLDSHFKDVMGLAQSTMPIESEVSQIEKKKEDEIKRA